jgi:lipopolysaccharide assembly LptE-like protein
VRLTWIAAAGLLMLASSCGYHAGGQGDLIPKTIHTIAIPAFSNVTTRYKLTDQLPEAIAREFISRTRYRIVTDTSSADAILEGAVLSYLSFPTIFDPATGTASAVEVHVGLRLTLRERATGKTLYSRPNYEIRERYEISINPTAYFEESDSALARAAQQTAQQVVSAILEAF